MTSVPRTRWLAVALAVVALSAGACTNQDADKDDVLNALEEAGVNEDQAKCVADDLDAALDQDQLNDVAGASDLEDLDSDLRDQVDGIVTTCLEGGGAAEETTTTAPGEQTTTTAAP